MAKTIKFKDMSSILGKASRNPAFRKKLLSSPAKTLKAAGYEPHKQAVSVIRSLKHKSFGAAPRRRRKKRRDSHAGSAAEA
jgi:hypothetical protein